MEIDNKESFINNINENINGLQKRTPGDIQEIFHLANIKESEITPIVQSLYSFVSLDKECDYKVLELDDHLLQSIKVGDSLSFRGEKKEPVILCSATRSYEIKEAESSNIFLLVPNLKCKNEIVKKNLDCRIIEEVEVKGSFNTYLEVRECSPKLSKLQLILEKSSFKGLEYEKHVDKNSLYDWNRLIGEVQASDGEIQAALPDYLIACIDGYYRLVSFEFEARALPLMVDLIEENSWQIDEVDKDVSYESLKEIIPKSVFDILFQKYTEPSEKLNENGSQLYKYNEAKYSRLLAQILLTGYPKNNYSDFMEAWQLGSPDIIPPKEEYLYGIAIITFNNQTMKKEVVLYPESNLPDNINKRLNELFSVKKKWTVPEITPYISKFATRQQDVNAILTKYARASTVNGKKHYSSKHAK